MKQALYVSLVMLGTLGLFSLGIARVVPADTQGAQAGASSNAPEQGAPGFLGVGFSPVHPALAAHLGLSEGVGVSVGDVLADSPAARAGIQRHDIVLSVDGKKINDAENLPALLATKKPGDKIQLEIIHKGARKAAEATLAARPKNLPETGPWPALPPQAGGSPWAPGIGNRDRIIVERPDGSQHVFPMPRGSFDPDAFIKEMEKSFPDFGGMNPNDHMAERIHKLLEKMHEDMQAGPGQWTTTKTSSATSVVRVVENGYDVTIRDENGVRTVTVKKGDKVIAENLPYNKLSTLPEEARERVEKAAENIHVEISPPIAPKPASPLKKSSGKSGLKA